MTLVIHTNIGSSKVQENLASTRTLPSTSRNELSSRSHVILEDDDATETACTLLRRSARSFIASWMTRVQTTATRMWTATHLDRRELRASASRAVPVQVGSNDAFERRIASALKGTKLSAITRTAGIGSA